MVKFVKSRNSNLLFVPNLASNPNSPSLVEYLSDPTSVKMNVCNGGGRVFAKDERGRVAKKESQNSLHTKKRE